jgi:hypothetical protein
MPVLLDASSVRPDTILLLDTFFQVSAQSYHQYALMHKRIAYPPYSMHCAQRALQLVLTYKLRQH